MNALKDVFQKQKAFIGFVVGGDGGVDYSVECCLQMIEGGVDILEIGLPFSDPVADGPIIQRAAQRSLEAGTTSKTILEIAKKIRKHTHIPLVLYSYFNPLLQKGNGFLNELAAAGFGSTLIVDLPPPIEESKRVPFFSGLRDAKLQPIALVAPSISDDRLKQVVKCGDGFIYYVCQKGTTGPRVRLPEDCGIQIQRIRTHSQLPVVIGFGISTKDHAREVISIADGFVVGSVFVKLMEERAHPTQLKQLARSLDPR